MAIISSIPSFFDTADDDGDNKSKRRDAKVETPSSRYLSRASLLLSITSFFYSHLESAERPWVEDALLPHSDADKPPDHIV